MKPNLVISCPATSRSGYGDHSRDLIRSLIAMDKFNVHIMDQMWGGCPRNALSIEDNDIISRILMEPMKQQPDVWIQVTVPNEFQPIGKYNIGITAGIETTICSAEWIEGCNRMNKVIVPSEHSKYVFQRTTFNKMDQQSQQKVGDVKCETPVEVLFEGLDLNVYKKTDKIPSSIESEINNIKEDFCFLICGHWLTGEFGQDRKDMGGAIKTFCEAFKNKSKKNQPALVLKTSGAGFSITERESILAKIKNVKNSITDGTCPKVYLLHGDLTIEEMNGLYNHPKIKAMISFTKGEGFGRPLLEFSNTGKPTIVSNWSGHVDFMSAYGILLPGKLQKVDKSVVWDKVILEDSEWFTVDYVYAQNIIIDIHKNYKKWLEKSRKQTQYIKENFSLEIMNEKFKEIMEDFKPNNIQQIPELAELQTYE